MTNRLAIGFAVLFCSAACSAVWAADYRPLDVKTGQWESTMTGQTSGMPPIPDEVLNRMTPEQRARMQAAMQARGAKTNVNKGCLTKDQLDKPFDLGDQNTRTCTRTLITSSGSRQEIRLDCNRQGMKSTGTIKLEAVNSENIKGSMLMTMTNGEHTMNMNYNFSAKWIGPACVEK